MRTVPIDRYVIETLMRDLLTHDKRPSAFIVYLHLWLRTHGDGKPRVLQSHQQLADATGLSKSAVQSAVHILQRRRLVDVKKKSKTATPEYQVKRPWSE